MVHRGKKYKAAVQEIGRHAIYTPSEAVALVKKVASANFDETVEVHLRTGLDPRHADQQVRSVVVLPHGVGKEVRVLVFAEGDAEKTALDAGADYAGTDELVKRIQEGWFEFDVAIAIPQVMSKVGRLGRELGRRRLMPNPKAGTIVQPNDLERVVKEAKLGRVEFRTDKTANIHAPIGKTSFSEEKLMGNFAAFMEAIMKARPSGAKGVYIKKVTLTSTMGPGIKVEPSAATALKVA